MTAGSFRQGTALAWIASSCLLLATPPLRAQPQATATPAAQSSSEEGQTSLDATFNKPQPQVEARRDPLRDTSLYFNLRSFYVHRNRFDDSESEAWAAGGWAGLETGYFFNHLAFGLTGYTSQRVMGDPDEGGTVILTPGQEGYSVLGELYAKIRIVDDLTLTAGRKGFDTPFINRDDIRMTPNTFEAIILHGETELEDEATLDYGAGYVDQIKNRDTDDFISMAKDAGVNIERGVFTASGLYQKRDFSIGAANYLCEDVMHITYLEAKTAVPLSGDWKLKLGAQYINQRSVGEALSPDGTFNTSQFEFKVELPVGNALFTTAYSTCYGDANLQNPWSGYPGYTAVQVQNFNREGEDAFLLRAGYDFKAVDGLSAYALTVFGTKPNQPDEYRQNEYNLNIQWAPGEGVMKGFSLRLRYALIEEFGGNDDTLSDLRLIGNYAISF